MVYGITTAGSNKPLNICKIPHTVSVKECPQKWPEKKNQENDNFLWRS